jgi:hypothetical protein
MYRGLWSSPYTPEEEYKCTEGSGAPGTPLKRNTNALECTEGFGALYTPEEQKNVPMTRELQLHP